MKKVFVIIDLIVFFIAIAIKLYSFLLVLNTYISYNLIFSLIFSILTLVALSFLLKDIKRRNFLFFLNLFISLLLVANINYFRYFKDIISLPVLINGFMLGTVNSSVATLFQYTDLLYFIDLILFNPLSFKIFNGFQKESFKLKKREKVSISFSILILAVAFQYSQFKELSLEQPKLLSTMYNKSYIVKKLGFLNYCYLDFYNFSTNFISSKKPIPTELKKDIKTFLQNNDEKINSYTGQMKGKNLIVIQVEALQEFVINNEINNEEITPNLNKWIKKSLYFNNFYYQVASGGTSDAEFMMNNSLYPSPSGAAYILNCGNEFDSMSQQFKANDYTTAAFHGFKDSFWNRNNMYKKVRFDTFYSQESFNLDDSVGLGLSDKSFLNQSLEKLKTMSKPYFSFLITLSSHYPFNDEKGFGNLNISGFDDSLIGNYLKSIHYTDEALGYFLEGLEKEGILKDSVVVIYGDHSAIPKTNINELAGFNNKESLSDLDFLKLQKVPFLIHFPEEQFKGINNNICGQIDIYPTLANLFALDHKNVMGRDLLSNECNKVIFRDGSFIKDNIYYNGSNNTFYNFNTGDTLNFSEELKTLKENVIKELEYSDDILKHNLLKSK